MKEYRPYLGLLDRKKTKYIDINLYTADKTYQIAFTFRCTLSVQRKVKSI